MTNFHDWTSGLNGSGATFGEAVTVLNANGFSASLNPISNLDGVQSLLQSTGNPVMVGIATYGGPHAVTVVGMFNGYVYVNNPASSLPIDIYTTSRFSSVFQPQFGAVGVSK